MIVLFRKSLTDREEFVAAYKHCNVVQNRSECTNNLVVGRYSVLPYYQELEFDLQHNKNKLINTYSQHSWIADFDYYDYVKDYTFESWTEEEFPNCNYDGPFVVKGKTNSKKHQWNKKMFAKDKRAAIELALELQQDSMLGGQGIIFRKYEPLITFEHGIGGVPITNEWRIFCYKDKIIDYGYYWSFAEKIPNKEDLGEDALKFAAKVQEVVAEYSNFFVMDIAQKTNKEWVLVELNDGQMSGLSCIDPYEFYYKLNETIDDN